MILSFTAFFPDFCKNINCNNYEKTAHSRSCMLHALHDTASYREKQGRIQQPCGLSPICRRRRSDFRETGFPLREDVQRLDRGGPTRYTTISKRPLTTNFFGRVSSILLPTAREKSFRTKPEIRADITRSNRASIPMDISMTPWVQTNY